MELNTHFAFIGTVTEMIFGEAFQGCKLCLYHKDNLHL